MQRDNCQLAEYEAWFQRECNALSLEPGFSLVQPEIRSLGMPDGPPWIAQFAIIYPDSMYVRISEFYRQLPKAEGSGGRLEHFGYHYGPCTSFRDGKGFPQQINDFVLRIDIDRRHERHIHYQGENHIPEARLPGLNFETIDPFQFIRAVEKHRKTSKPLHELLGFKVERQK